MDPSVHQYAIRKDPKSLAQVWRAQLKGYVESPQADIVQVWQELKLFKLKR
jgi:hypothetical protein